MFILATCTPEVESLRRCWQAGLFGLVKLSDQSHQEPRDGFWWSWIKNTATKLSRTRTLTCYINMVALIRHEEPVHDMCHAACATSTVMIAVPTPVTLASW